MKDALLLLDPHITPAKIKTQCFKRTFVPFSRQPYEPTAYVIKHDCIWKKRNYGR